MLKRLARQLLIQEDEAGTVAYFLLFFLLVGCGMAIGRGTADALFLKRLGIEYLPLMYMVQSLVLAAVTLGYAAFADRLPAERLFRKILAVLALLVLASWFAMSRSTGTLVYPLYYLLYEVASEVLLVHAALYMSQNMTTLQAKRLAPLALAGSTTGIILGGVMLALLAPLIGTQNLLIIWCVLLLAGMALILGWHRRTGPSAHFRAPRRSGNAVRESVVQVQQGLRYTWSSELLRAAAFATFFMVITFYILCYSVNRVYTQAFQDEAALASFFGILTAATSGIALLLQLLVTNRAIRHFGIRRINLVFPVTSIASLSLLAGSFTLPVALLGSLNKDTLMPAFRNPVRTLFFNVIPAYMQGRARAISVAVVLPLALFTCGLLLYVMQQAGNPVLFILPGVATALLYLACNRAMNRAYEGTLIRTMKEKLFLPDRRLYTELNGAGRDIFEQIIEGFNNPDPGVAMAYARLLVGSFPERSAEHILTRIPSVDSATADRLVGLLGDDDIRNYREQLFSLAGRGDAHLHDSILRRLATLQEPHYIEHARGLVADGNPRLRSAGLHYCLQFPQSREELDRHVGKWRELLGEDTGACLAACALIPDLARLDPDQRERLAAAYLAAFEHMLASDDAGVLLATLRGLGRWPLALPPAAYPALAAALDDENPDIRAAAAACLHHAGAYPRESFIMRAVADSHPGVRQAGMQALRTTSDDYPAAVFRIVLDNRLPLRGQFALLESLLDAGLPPGDFEPITTSKTGEAQRLQDALDVLSGRPAADTPARALLRLVLRERLDMTIQLALLSLESVHEPGIIHTIRAGLASQDPRQIANAGEALGNLEGGTATRLLQQVLASRHDLGDRSRDAAFGSVTEVVDWCRAHSDEWLRECAGYFSEHAPAGETLV